jgi:predicted  nucleic acid-binding Zn-ribbon protein
MFSKKEIDNFILREASKYLFEEDLTDDVESIETSISKLEDRIEQNKEDIKTLDIKKKDADKNKSATPDEHDKRIATIESEKYAERLKTAKEDEKRLKDDLKGLEIEKKQKEQSKTETSKQIAAGETVSEAVQVAPIKKAAPVKPKPKKKELIVRFDTNTPTPFTVKFTSRGFVVGNTRLSFELLDKAISKQFSVTLKNGLVLTPVKMQKILKYKNRY